MLRSSGSQSMGTAESAAKDPDELDRYANELFEWMDIRKTSKIRLMLQWQGLEVFRMSCRSTIGPRSASGMRAARRMPLAIIRRVLPRESGSTLSRSGIAWAARVWRTGSRPRAPTSRQRLDEAREDKGMLALSW